MPTTIRYRVPLRGLKISSNEFYAGTHWTRRKQIKDSWLSVAGGFCRPVQKAGPYPIEISYRFVLGSRGLDTLNTAIMAKMLEDSLRTLGILEDDDPAHVARSVLEVVVLPRKKKKKASDASGPQADAADEDWLEIKINSL